MPGNGNQVPSGGDQVEQWRNGVRRVGRVWYSDDLQVLVKWTTDGQAVCVSAGTSSRSANPARTMKKPRRIARVGVKSHLRLRNPGCSCRADGLTGEDGRFGLLSRLGTPALLVVVLVRDRALA